ncbi:hypothetical protein H4Q32_023044 [Labeo rohita]|uniref:CCHC-type domain-containing protein n=1 Tax=Labeo rohita TaxID=84645 RepID=A0ABQ8MTK7_LABRO|nr:hypothetical protein H4Q32_023044 [Labeo rohita]
MTLHVIGEDALDIYNSFQIPVDEFKLQNVMDRFEEYFVPKLNVMYEKYKFFSCNQKGGESFDQYLAELHTLSKTCDFGDLRKSLIKRLLRKQDLTLEKAVNICRAAETICVQAKELNKQDKTVHALKNIKPPQSKNKQGKTQSESNKYECGKCGRRHEFRMCPAFGKTCNKCGKRNHYAKCCKTKSTGTKVHTVEENTEAIFMDAINVSSICKEEWIVPLTVSGTIVPFKLDTGAQVNLISEKEYKTLRQKPKLHKVKIKVTGYTREEVPVKGSCTVNVLYKRKHHKIQMLVIGKEVQPILGLKTCERLDLVKKVFVANVHKDTDNDQLLDKFRDIFEGLGCLPGKHKIYIDHQVAPVIHACRKVPLALRGKLQEELLRMEKLGVVAKTEEPTDWVSSLHTVEKKNGQLWICLDPRDLIEPSRESTLSYPLERKSCHNLQGQNGLASWTLLQDSGR